MGNNVTEGLQSRRLVSLESRAIGEGEPVFVIAEVGINHEGSVEMCARMIDAAAAAGADAVKLQTINPDENYVTGSESYTVFKGSELSREETAAMFDYSRTLGLEIFTTSGDSETLDWVEKLKPAAHKISSGLMTNANIVKQAARYPRPILISTGVAEIQEIDDVVETVRSISCAELALFQCTSLYPTPIDDVNLAAIEWLSDRYDAPAGFSDHTSDDEAAVLSVAAGAVMIEKHFTLTPDRPGYDHLISLAPQAFERMVKRVRQAERLMGRAGKSVPSELRTVRDKLLRCLIARKPIAAGERFTRDNLGLKRPTPERRGLDPKHYDLILGSICLRELQMDDPVTADMVGEQGCASN